MYSLDIVNKDDSVPAICFNDPDDPEHAVVVFRGTSGKDEWIDNAIGLGVSDTHLLSGIVRCPVCGAGMYGNKSIKYKKDGTKYKDFFYYGCKHRSMQRGHKCDYKKQIREELLDDAVAEVIVKLVSNPQFAAMMQEKNQYES